MSKLHIWIFVSVYFMYPLIRNCGVARQSCAQFLPERTHNQTPY
jgi:hypothetical protein